MRGTRWLLLVAIVVIVGGIVAAYRIQRKANAGHSPQKPNALPVDLNSVAEEWHLAQTDGKPPFRTTFDIRAKNFRQVKDSNRVDLEQVELKLYHKDDQAFDLVKSAAATYFNNDRRLYSDGDVEITLGVPVDTPPTRRLVSIRSSGVNFDCSSGRAETERPATFTFQQGDGQATGAIYDPTTHTLEMKQDVEIHWKAPNPNAKPMKIEGASLRYYELKSEIWLSPWGRVTRDNSVIEGEDAVVHIKEKVLDRIEARRARGTNTYPKRRVEYKADGLWVNFDENGVVAKVVGEGNAHLLSDAEATATNIAANRVEMDFIPDGNESALHHVTATGHSVVEAQPKPMAGRIMPETHILRSEAVDMTMRAGGKEIEKVVTQTSGQLEFVPNVPVQHHRLLDAQAMTILYGPQNRIESYRATQAKTRTDPTDDERKRNRVTSYTTSRDLLARFEPKTSRMANMEQWGDFTYDEGDRHARSVKASLDSAQNLIHLDQNARMWDATGATSGDRIHLDQRTGNFTADGHVNSSRMPDQGKKKTSEMLSGDEPLQAQANKMDSSHRNQVIHYEGGVTMWQGSNRIQAEVVDIDREKHTLIANGNVVSNLWEQPKQPDPKQPQVKAKPVPANPVLTVVHAPRLVYTDSDRLAYYTGGVHLTRPGMDVRSVELRAWLSESGSDSSLDRAWADGTVKIIQSAAGRTRTGTGEHGEYYTKEQKIYLRGGRPQLDDSRRGRTQGNELTYFANDDRLLVNGAPDRPANSVLRKK